MSEHETARFSAQEEALARLAVVYADELRMRIVSEAYIREISPTMFHNEFGGGSIPRVCQHFDRLTTAGWLSLERTATGGPRRGSVEHFYRASELAIFEEETWALLPASMRAGFSWMTFEHLTERVGAALVADTFNAHDDRHLSWTPVLVDETGWKQILAAADMAFRTVLEEQERASLRLKETGDKSMLSTVAFAVFESPIWLRDQIDWRNRQYASALGIEIASSNNRSSFFPMLARVCANPLDLRIIDKLNQDEMSPKLFHAEFPNVTLASFDRRLKKLSGQGWATEVRQGTGSRRTPEHFYRAVGPALIDNESWAKIPGPIKATITSRTFEQLREKVKDAIDAGTFDSRVDRHLTWTTLRLDDAGWENVVDVVDRFFELLFYEEKASKKRLATSGEEPVLVTVGLAAFESPEEIAKVH